MSLTTLTFITECPVCACELNFNSDVEENELLECIDCGTELEVSSISPFEVIEAPTEEEDWGE